MKRTNSSSIENRETSGSEDSPLLGGNELFRSLGYPTAAAFRQALRRGQIPIDVFSIPNRRGKFALRADFNRWLMSLKSETLPKKGEQD